MMTEVLPLYRSKAAEFDCLRGKCLMERPYLDALLDGLGHSPSVFDLGCGTGEPIARYLVGRGCRVTGLDGAPEMLEIARHRMPEVRWLVADMRALSLGERFDAIVAWDSFFHLTADAQRAMFAVFDAHCAPRARLLVTTGTRAGTVVGELFGEPLHHASLDAAEYRERLAAIGFKVVRHSVEDPACGRHTVWLAERGVAPTV